MELVEITKRAGANRKRRRVGRGPGSGKGKTCGRGHKGGGSRSGWSRRGFAEGGQMPISRRLPKRGFSNARFAARFNVVNLRDLENRFESGAHVSSAALMTVGLIRHKGCPVKILGQGELTKKLTVEAARFSKQAAEKITAAGGEVRVVGSDRSDRAGR